MAAPLDAVSWVTIRPLDWPWLQPIRRHHFAVGVVVYLVLWVGSAFAIGKPVAAVAVPALAIALLAPWRRAYKVASMIAGSLVLQLLAVGIGFGDQVALANAAASRALSGQNPYGVGFDALGGVAYSYGPLGLVWWLPGIPLEVLAGVLTMVVLGWARAWVALAVFGAWLSLLVERISGSNDASVGLLLLVALVVLYYRPVAGAAVLAAAAAIKPYAAAWYVPAIGYLGWQGAAVLAVVTLALWSPVLLVWNPGSYLRSVDNVEQIRIASAARGATGTSVADLPLARLFAVPVGLLGLVVRQWRPMVLIGAASFSLFLFFSPFATFGYLTTLIPILGLAIEWEPRPVSSRPSDSASEG